MRYLLLFLALAATALSAAGASSSSSSSFSSSSAPAMPQVMLWSWQKIEDLRSVDAKNVGVAYLVGRFIVRGNEVVCQPRLSRLQLPGGCYREAVARVEVKALPTKEKSALVCAELAGKIAQLTLPNKISAVQIDFDARQNERQFYLQLLRDLRQALPPDIALSTTALASWSQGDLWLKEAVDQSSNGVKIDNVVPMFFTMGIGRGKALRMLAEKLPVSFNNKLSIGLSLSEPAAISAIAPRLKQFNHIYLFCSPGWSSENLIKAGKLIDIKLTEEKKIGSF